MSLGDLTVAQLYELARILEMSCDDLLQAVIGSLEDCRG